MLKMKRKKSQFYPQGKLFSYIVFKIDHNHSLLFQVVSIQQHIGAKMQVNFHSVSRPRPLRFEYEQKEGLREVANRNYCFLKNQLSSKALWFDPEQNYQAIYFCFQNQQGQNILEKIYENMTSGMQYMAYYVILTLLQGGGEGVMNSIFGYEAFGNFLGCSFLQKIHFSRKIGHTFGSQNISINLILIDKNISFRKWYGIFCIANVMIQIKSFFHTTSKNLT